MRFGVVQHDIVWEDRAANFARLFERMSAAGMVYRDITRDETLAEFLV